MDIVSLILAAAVNFGSAFLGARKEDLVLWAEQLVQGVIGALAKHGLTLDVSRIEAWIADAQKREQALSAPPATDAQKV